MSVRSLGQLKSWFQQGCYPVASQFADWMDSFRHKDELIGLSDIEGLSEQLNGKSNASEVAALQAQTEALDRDFAAHCSESAADIEALYDGIEELETEDQRLDSRISSGDEATLQAAKSYAEQKIAEEVESSLGDIASVLDKVNG